MKGRATINLFGIVAVLFAAKAASSEVLYSTANCSANPLANFWKCQALEVEVPTDVVTATENELFRQFGYENRLEIQFQCKASVPFSAEYRVGPTHAFLGPTEAPTVQTVVTPVPYEGEKAAFKFAPDPFSIVLPGCRLEIVSNVTAVRVNEVKRYADELAAAIELQIETQKNLSEAESLPAKWVVVRELASRLQTQAEFKKLQREELVAAGTPTDQLDLEIADLELLREQLDGAMPENDPCSLDGSSPNAFCLSKVSEVNEDISAELAKKLEAAQGLAEFLEAEINRLAQRALAVSAKLEAILNSLNLHTEGT